MKKLIALVLVVVLAASAFCLEAFAAQLQSGFFEGKEWTGRHSASKSTASCSIDWEGDGKVRCVLEIISFTENGAGHFDQLNRKPEYGYKHASKSLSCKSGSAIVYSKSSFHIKSDANYVGGMKTGKYPF